MGLRSPAYGLQSLMGARFEEHHLWEIVHDFGSPEREYNAVRVSAGVYDLSHLGILRVTGPDRLRYLHSMLSNDIKNLQPGRGAMQRC